MATKTAVKETTAISLNGNGHQPQPSTQSGSQTYTFKPTDEPPTLDPADMEEELRNMDRAVPEGENHALPVDRAAIHAAQATPAAHKPWYARLWSWLVESVAIIVTLACSAVIGALAAVPLTPSVYDVARHFRYVGFWTYHWTTFSSCWFDHYTDSLRFWYYATAATVATAVFLLALCTGRSK